MCSQLSDVKQLVLLMFNLHNLFVFGLWFRVEMTTRSIQTSAQSDMKSLAQRKQDNSANNCFSH